jgi:hypothetical protein
LRPFVAAALRRHVAIAFSSLGTWVPLCSLCPLWWITPLLDCRLSFLNSRPKQKAGACSAQAPAAIFSFVIEKSVLPMGLAELPRDHLAISRVIDEVVPRGRLGHLDQLPLGLLQALYGSDPELRFIIRQEIKHLR